jgi:myo-inositol-1(or 4)-monophosphatase
MQPSASPKTPSKLDTMLSEHQLKQSDLTKIHDLLISIAMDAGAIMVSAEHEFLTSAGTKNNTADIVTKYDIQIETMVQERVHAAYPTLAFLGEETYKSGTTLAPTPTVICDPIDGTLNFSHGVPNCAISLALAINKESVIGVVYNPFRDDLFRAIRGRGAFLEHPRTRAVLALPLRSVPAPLPGLRAALVALEWGNQRAGPNWALRRDVHAKLLTDVTEGGAMVKSVRSQGSAALDFCYVAQGVLDVFWEGGVWVWDVAAGWCILEEAGGMVASANPGDWAPTLEGRVYFAVRAAGAEEQRGVVEELWELMKGRKFEY